MRILSFFVALFAVTTLGAQRYEYLTFRLLNGNECSMNITSGATITFENASLVMNAGDKQLDLALSDLNAMYFAASPTGINDATAIAVKASYSNGTLQVTAPAGCVVSVYGLDGRAVATLKKSTNGTERYSLPLSNGMYIVRVGQQSVKILAQ